MRWHTDNDLRGATLNPWDAGRTPGGSSGGEGAALALGMSPLGLANDYGGSIRYPSQCCGTAGLRPTFGRLAMFSGLAPVDYGPRIGPAHRPRASLGRSRPRTSEQAESPLAGSRRPGRPPGPS